MDVRRLKQVVDRVLTSGVPEDKVVWVTELTQCLRKSFYMRKMPVRRTPEMLLGEVLHRDILTALAYELNCSAEVPVELDMGDFKLVGRADLVCDDCVVELKISKSRVVRESWVRQANTYACILKKPYYYIVVVSDATSVFQYVSDYRLFGEVLSRARKYYVEHIARGEPPPPEESNLCDLCEFRNLCSNVKDITKFMR